MSEWDVVVVGAGPAGCSAAGILTKKGLKVLLLDKLPHEGGKGTSWDEENTTYDVGAHLLSGNALPQVRSFINKPLELSEPVEGLTCFVDGSWQDIRETYEKEDLKDFIKLVTSIEEDEIDRLDDVRIRDYLKEKGIGPSAIDLVERISMTEFSLTSSDIAASEVLHARKVHLEENGVLAYSVYPMGENGFRSVFTGIIDFVEEEGGNFSPNTEVNEIIIGDGKVEGVEIQKGSFGDFEIIEAPKVIAANNVWGSLDILPSGVLPAWYEDGIKKLAKDKYKTTIFGFYFLLDSPLSISYEKEVCCWWESPSLKLPGHAFSPTMFNPDLAPEGKHLYVVGCHAEFEKLKDGRWRRHAFKEFLDETYEMFPELEDHVVKKERYFTLNPPVGVAQHPRNVGRFKPSQQPPDVDGLYFAGDTFRTHGVGTDAAARSGISVAEKVLNEKIQEFSDLSH